MKNVLFICILLFASPVISMGANDHTIEVEFSFNPQNTPEKLLIGYRLYKQGEQVCDTGIPQNNSISCNFSSEDGTFDFALTARYSDNTESSPSPLFPFTISSVAETDHRQ